jgi:N-acetyl-anhydromuramyl-L-alanine amidase AmpD
MKLYEARIGVMLHYDASASDAGAVAWLTQDPRCRVSYHGLVLDDGGVVEIAPWHMRAWHAGVCRSSSPYLLRYRDANSAFYGLAAAARDGDVITEAQYGALLRLVVERFQAEGWSLRESWRLVGHDTEAWPRGRKHDPTGSTPEQPVLSVPRMREWLETAR